MKFSELKNEALERTCRQYRVEKLYVFGSVVTGDASTHSDLDFLVQFQREGYEGAFDQYMGFKERLEEIYQRPVDLLQLKTFRNPIFQQAVDRSKKLLYAA